MALSRIRARLYTPRSNLNQDQNIIKKNDNKNNNNTQKNNIISYLYKLFENNIG